VEGPPAEGLVVVDNFLDDPDEVRAFALKAEYVPAWGSWQGLHSLERHPGTREVLFQIAALVSSRSPNWDEIDASYQYWKKASCGGFAAMFSGDEGVIHAHRRSGDWAGVVYLSTPEDCRDRPGTVFFRHRATGLNRITRADELEEPEEAALADCRDARAWTELGAVPMGYNRLVLFDSRYFHSASAGFGADLASCRLIQVFNFCLIPE
jgi:hypothetical protein